MKNRKSVISLVLISFLFSCNEISNSNNNINTLIKNSVPSNIIAKKLTTNSYVVDLGQSKNNKELNIKIKLPSSFNTKALSHRAFIKDVKSLKIYLTESNSSPIGFLFTPSPIIVDTYDGTRTNESQEFDINIKNITPNITKNLYAYVEAYDGTNGTGNNISEENTNYGFKGVVSSNYVTIDYPTLTYTFSNSYTDLDVDLRLSATTSVLTDYPIHKTATPNRLSNVDMSLDNAGMGFVSWLNTENSNKDIDFAEITEYIPNTLPTGLPNPTNVRFTRTLLNNTDYQSIAYDSNSKRGLVVFTSMGATKNLSYLSINNGIIGNTELPVTTLIGGQVTEKPQVVVNSKGNGLILFHSNMTFDGSGIESNSNIFAVKVYDFTPTGKPFPIFYNQDAFKLKEKPRFAINNEGHGVATWQEKNANGDYDIILSHIKKYDQTEMTGNGNISLSGQNITGVGTFFTDQLQVGSRIVIGSSEYYVNTVMTDSTCKVNNPNSDSHTGVNFNVKGGFNAFPNTTVNTTNIILASNPPKDLVAGQRLINKQNGEILIIDSGSGTNYNLLRNSTSQGTFTLLSKESYLLNQNAGNGTNSKNPTVKMTNSGDGVVVWKDDRYNGAVGDSIKIRGFSALPNFQLFPIENTLQPSDGNNSINTFNCPPALSMNNKGEGIVAWSEGNPIVGSFYIKFINFGNISYSITPLNTGAYTSKNLFPFASLNADGNGVVGWVYNTGVAPDKLLLRNFKAFSTY